MALALLKKRTLQQKLTYKQKRRRAIIQRHSSVKYYNRLRNSLVLIHKLKRRQLRRSLRKKVSQAIIRGLRVILATLRVVKIAIVIVQKKSTKTLLNAVAIIVRILSVKHLNRRNMRMKLSLLSPTMRK